MKKLLIASLLFALPVAVENTLQIPLGTSVEAAQDQAKKKKRRRPPPLREKTHKALSEAQILIDPANRPEPENGKPLPPMKADPRKAVDLLKGLLNRRGMNEHEIAQTWSTLAYAYYTLEDLKQTKVAYENVLKQPKEKISLAMELQALRSLFQLYYQDEAYKKSIDFMKRWEKANGKEDATVAYLMASAYYQINQFQAALKEALRVEKIVKEQDKTLKEPWLYIQVILYNELKDTNKVISTLERLIVAYPKKQYWMHLAGMYAEKEWDDKALSAYYAAYVQDMFDKESEMVMLSQRLLNAEVPWEAARILEEGLKTKMVEKNEKNMKLLASAYTMAQEHDKAINAWRDASTFADTGEIAYRLAQALSNEDRHKEAVAAYNEALNKGGLRDIAEVNFWLGISQMQLSRWNDAKKAFREAAKDKGRAKSARQYIKYIEGEQRRLKALKEMLEA